MSYFPAGSYKFRHWRSPSLGRTVLRMDDAEAAAIGRSGLLVHNANYVRQVLGCVAVGLSWKSWPNEGSRGVANSAAALEMLIANTAAEVTLVVNDYSR